MNKLCFIDTETTGTDPKKHGLIQLAGIIVVGGSELESFDFRPAPFESDVIDDSALAVNGVARDGLAKLEKPSIVHDAFQTILGGHVDKFEKRDKFFFVGYNASFDMDFVRAFFVKCGNVYFGSWFFFPPIDVMNLAAVRLMDERPMMLNFKLGTVADALGLKTEGALHDALTDVRLTKELFYKLREF